MQFSVYNLNLKKILDRCSVKMRLMTERAYLGFFSTLEATHNLTHQVIYTILKYYIHGLITDFYVDWSFFTIRPKFLSRFFSYQTKNKQKTKSFFHGKLGKVSEIWVLIIIIKKSWITYTMLVKRYACCIKDPTFLMKFASFYDASRLVSTQL